MQANFNPVEPAEWVRRFHEPVANDKATNPRGVYAEAVRSALTIGDSRPIAAAVEIQWILRESRCPVQPMGLVDVETEELRFADAAVDRSRNHHGVIAENIGHCDRRAAEDAPTKVVPRVADSGTHDVIGGETHLVRLEREFIG